jgi:hypothetical protein
MRYFGCPGGEAGLPVGWGWQRKAASATGSADRQINEKVRDWALTSLD